MHIEVIIGILALIATLMAIYSSSKIALKTDMGISKVIKRSIVLLTTLSIGIIIYIISHYTYIGISSERIIILTLFIYMIGISINRSTLDHIIHKVLDKNNRGGGKRYSNIRNLRKINKII